MQTSLFSWNWGSTAKHLVSLTNFLWQTFNRGLLFLTPYPKHTINNRNCKDFFKISSWSCVESNFCDVNVRLISKIWAIGLILMIPEFLLQYTMNCLLLLKTMQLYISVPLTFHQRNFFLQLMETNTDILNWSQQQ